jgi:hypothetical protein
MEKSVIIFLGLLAVSSLMAFHTWRSSHLQQDAAPQNQPTTNERGAVKLFAELEVPELIYKVDSRFATTITKEKLAQARSIIDIVPKQATEGIESYQHVKVALLQQPDQEIIEMGEGDALNLAQQKLLQAADYSTDFYIIAQNQRRNEETRALESDRLVYYLTVVPEAEASYSDGHEALISYLKGALTAKGLSMPSEKLEPGRAIFTISRKGSLQHARLGSSCGYPEVDSALLEALSNLPGTWQAATNARGEAVPQDFVFFFGIEGC